MINTTLLLRAFHVLALSAFLFADPTLVFAREIEVGPGHEITVLDRVPWDVLLPGDHIKIHWKARPYRGKWVICRRGTAEQPIRISGVLGPNGEKPVINGRNAISSPRLDYWSEERGIIKIGGAEHPADTMPAHIIVENLEVTGGRPPNQFVNKYGVTKYADNAAAIFVEKGEHITIRNCVLRDSANGLFVGPNSRNILIEGCQFRDNGMEGSMYEHNSYTAGI